MKKIKKPVTKNAAVCFSGMAKTLELCYPYIKKNLLDPLGDYDIFCYTEDDENAEKVKLLKPVRTEKIKSSDVDKILKAELRTLKRQNYKTCIYPETFRFNLRNVYQQLYKINGSFNLLERYMKENNVSYKHFIRARFDMLPLDTFNTKDFKIKKNEIIIPNIKDLVIKDQINDMFCITKDFETFKLYCSLYLNFPRVVQERVSIKPTLPQKIYFFFEKIYSSLCFFLFRVLNKKHRTFPRQLLGLSLLLPKIFYKDFKARHMCNLERVLFYYLNSENKKIKNREINFIIVRDTTNGLLVFG